MSTSIRTPDLGTALVVALAAVGAALMLALFVLASPAVSGSTDLLVNKTADTNDGVCNSDCSLREAIIRANTSGADNIDVPAGTYKLTLTGSGEDFAATGDLDIRRGITIRPEEGNGPVTIDGNGIDRVFHTPFQSPSTPFTVSIFGVKITGGDVLPEDGPGGGIFHDAQGATLFLSNSTVSDNNAASGGGIMAQRGPLNLSKSTVSGNTASSQGGGIQFGGTGSAGTLKLTNTTVSGNQSNIGGGILLYEPLEITDSTIAFNTAQNNSGGIYKFGSVATLKNTIVSNNKSEVSPTSNNCSDPVTSEGNNLEKGTSCGFTEPGDKNADPKLSQLANNGGPTNTHALSKGSPAIDAGGEPFPPTDQRGVLRPQGGIASDIGAYEKEQNLNVVQCPTGGSSTQCVGTSASDALIGTDDDTQGGDYIQGGEGNDLYNGKGGGDSWEDSSLKSSDRYLVSVEDFNTIGIDALSIQDNGGRKDILDLSRFYESTDFQFFGGSTALHMDGPGNNDIFIYNFFTTDSIDVFKFSDKTLTAKQVKNMIV